MHKAVSDLSNKIYNSHPRRFKKASLTSGMRITKRDVSLLRALPDYQALTTTQIQRLFFPSLSRAQKRLRILSNHGLLKRHYRSVAIGSGSVETVFFPTIRGVRILNSLGLELGKNAITPRREFSDMFLNHTLARNDFRIGLELVLKYRPDINFVTWKHGKSIARTVTMVYGENQPVITNVTLIPDGLFELEFNGQNHRYYIENDLGTTSLPRIRMKLSAYTELAIQDRLQVHDGSCPFKVLWITRAQRRLHSLIRTCEQVNQGRFTRDLFWFTSDRPNWLDDPTRIMSLIWNQPGSTASASILDFSGKLRSGSPFIIHCDSGSKGTTAHKPFY